MNNTNNIKSNIELICIVCPKGCHLTIDKDLNVIGNGCKRGIEYGKAEVTNPTRVITSTIKVINGEINRVPVITDKPIPKNKIFEVMNEINKVIAKAPIKVKDILIENVLNLGVNVVSTRNINIKQ